MISPNVSAVLYHAIEDLSKQESAAEDTIAERNQTVETVKYSLEKAKELEACAHRDDQKARKQMNEFREFINGLKDEDRSSQVLHDSLNNLTALQAQSFKKHQESSSELRRLEERLNFATNRLAIAEDDLKTIREKKAEASKHLLS